MWHDHLKRMSHISIQHSDHKMSYVCLYIHKNERKKTRNCENGERKSKNQKSCCTLTKLSFNFSTS